ncbi:hypothetical protein [Terribacillus saccharophilus]|uniref:hypothetical protein n=1 Tax=Terribacillus saccharophilus TaxID=361277 RepID=UPI000C9BA8A8|nr:hypothetical protein [Terribacillus goriensis]
MEKAIVPKDVAKAFDIHLEYWKGQSRNAILLQFMAVPYAELGVATATLSRFALKYPETYLQAVLHGYEPRIETAGDLADVIEIWAAKPFEGDDERKDIELLAGSITKHFQI